MTSAQNTTPPMTLNDRDGDISCDVQKAIANSSITAAHAVKIRRARRESDDGPAVRVRRTPTVSITSSNNADNKTSARPMYSACATSGGTGGAHTHMGPFIPQRP